MSTPTHPTSGAPCPTPRRRAATFVVTNTSDSGAGSLRQAIDDANNSAGADTITFQAGVTGTITVGSVLKITEAVDIQGPGAAVLAVDGADSSLIFYVYDADAAADVSISGLTISNGLGSGAGVFNYGERIVLDSVVMTGNTGTYGAALYSENTGGEGTVTIRNSTFTNNVSARRGGAVAVWGTAVSANPVVTIENSTFSGNSVVDADQGGGAVYLYNASGPVRITNSTFTGNSGGDGGALYLSQSGTDVIIANSTISGNSGVTSGGASFYATDPTFVNTILAGNTASDGESDLYLSNSTATANYSLIGTGVVAGGANNIVTDAPMLGALADNGGSTLTMLPLAGSPAIDAGDPAFAAPPATDQRGGARVFNGRVDIGAVEVGSDPELPPTGGSNGIMVGLGAALLGIGGVLHLSGHRKRTADQA